MPKHPRYAVLDVGSNTAKVLIAQKVDGGFEPLFEEAHACRLSEGFARGRIKKAAVDRTVSALKYFLLQCRRFEVERIASVGTAALREASNASALLDQAAALGLPIEVIPGEEEARLSYLAVRRDPHWAEVETLVTLDIGGASSELAWGRAGETHPGLFSMPLGAVKLTEKYFPTDPVSAESVHKASRAARKRFEEPELPASVDLMVGVGGTCVNVASVAAHAAGMPEKIHGRRIGIDELASQIALYSELALDQRRRINGLDPARADIILGGAIILQEGLRRAGRRTVEISNRGLRWGLLFDRFGD